MITTNPIGDVSADESPFKIFHTYATLTGALQKIATNYSNIAVLYDLGHSVQGRTLWGLKITDNPGVEENEPEVRIAGSHHGDEYMSVELPLLLANYLVENYTINPEITDLVNNHEIWIIPMVNPDGREAESRENANGVDLNRDYGYMWDGEGSPSPFSQPETQSMRNHSLDNNFVFSLSYHCSGNIIHTIWNYKPQPPPDTSILEKLSTRYSSHNDYKVKQGYEWYQTRGDLNDFSYGCRGTIDWTIEVQTSHIADAWSLNREAMIEIIDAADMGLTGLVTDASTGDPIAATVWVEQAYWPCFTDPKIGDYHRVLLNGTYTVHFSANGYQDQLHTIQINNSNEPTILNVAMSPAVNYYASQVTWCNYYDPYRRSTNNFQNNPTEAISALNAPDGICASLGVGGTLVLDMGESGEVVDGSGDDFTVFEGGSTQDSYSVYISANWNGPWISMGLGTGTISFDLSDGNIQQIRFIKIDDENDGDAYETNPGVDIDAVQTLHAFLTPIPKSSGDGDGGRGGSGTSKEPPNKKPIATISANERYKGIVNTEIFFNGSASYDPDGTITTYEWSFGDNTTTTGITPSHIYQKEGTYTVTLTVTDNNGNTAQNTTTALIAQNHPPSQPSLTGSTHGTITTQYNLTIYTTDPDNDTVSYTIHWSDDTNITSTDFVPNGTTIPVTHQWATPGIYTIKAYATDKNNATSEIMKLTVIINVHYVHTIGYLIDTQNDSTYDLFYSNITGNSSLTRYNNYYYLIDTDNDGSVNYQYNIVTEELKIYSGKQPTNQFPLSILLLLIVSAVIILVMIALVIKILRKQQSPEKTTPAETIGYLYDQQKINTPKITTVLFNEIQHNVLVNEILPTVDTLEMVNYQEKEISQKIDVQKITNPHFKEIEQKINTSKMTDEQIKEIHQKIDKLFMNEK